MFLLYSSSSPIISIALILGAPLNVPAGKTEETILKSETSFLFWPNTSETMCITCW